MTAFSVIEFFSVIFLNLIIFTSDSFLFATLHIFTFVHVLIIFISLLGYTLLNLISDTLINHHAGTIIIFNTFNTFLLDCFTTNLLNTWIFIVLVVLWVDSLVLIKT